MARGAHTHQDFNLYDFEIELTVRRRTDTYSSTTLGTVDIKRQIPLANDWDANEKLRELVQEELDRTFAVVNAHIDFETKVKQLTGGSTIDSEAY